MNYKRLELYLGWKCNYKCIFCIEMEKIKKYFNKNISFQEILKLLIKYRKEGYNHVTFLGGEPFIQHNFIFALKIAKKLGYKILVTTNGIVLPFESKAKLFLPYINELIISIPVIDNNLQPFINGVSNTINFEKVFNNIEKYWEGNFLKINVVFNKYNYLCYKGIFDFLGKYKSLITEISFTYPELNSDFYGEKYLKEKVAVKYTLLDIKGIINYSLLKGMKIKLVDIPFCILGEENINFSDDLTYQKRTKINNKGIEKQGGESNFRPRERYHILKCKGCKFLNKCWGPSKVYIDLYGDIEINPIK